MPKLRCDWFVDGVFVGQTKGTVFFSSPVDTGEHWVYAMQDGSKNRLRAFRLRFEAGKAYYILAKEVPRALILIGQSEAQFNEYRAAHTPAGLVRDTGGDTPELKESHAADAREEFERDLADDPKRMEDLVGCKGY